MQKTDNPTPEGATVTEVLREELCSMEQREAADIAAGRFKSFDTKALLRDHLRSVANKATAPA